MADDNSYRFRSNDGRAAAKAPAGNDPLAELARLIGQTDPFAEFGKQPRADAHQAPQHADVAWNAPPVAPAQSYGAPAYDRQPVPGYEQQFEEPHAGYAQQGFDEPASAQAHDDPYYRHDPSEAVDVYDDVPPRRRFTVIVIAVVFGLVVVGTAGAVGYRALFGKTGSSPPPVIKADTAPSKVVPTSKAEPQSNKLIYDRVGGGASNEKVVSREEQPVDLSKVPQQPLMPGGPSASNTSSSPAATGSSVAPAGSVAPAPLDAPKKVKTIAIKPDQPQSTPEAPAPAATATAPTPRPTPAPPQRLASAPAISAADVGNAPPSRAAPARQVQVEPPRNNGPLSLSPNAAPVAPIQREPVRTASAPPRAMSAPVMAGGGYAVQVSSQRSEAEAQAAFRSLQGKFPAQLGSRQPLIRRADLGSKGIYFRAMVGPFANSGDAGALCQSLKAAGGNCLVQKN